MGRELKNLSALVADFSIGLCPVAGYTLVNGNRQGNETSSTTNTKRSSAMTSIEIFGPGCKRCKQLQANAEQAIGELGLDATVEKVEDINRMVECGVIMTPALAIDGQVKFAGKVASADEIKRLFN